MSDESNEKRQSDELEALQAIYVDAVVDNRGKNAWNIWRPLDILLTLNPLHSSDVKGVHCSVTLHIKCCENYPDKPPTILIDKINGLSKENELILLDELKTLATEKCGEVMIFELAQHVQNFLADHNKPTLSFYDEMVQQRNQKAELKQRSLQVKEDEERQKIKDEIQKRQAILKCGGRQRLQSTSLEMSDDGQGDGPEQLVYYADNMSPAKVQRSKSSEVPCTCNIKAAQVFRLTQKGNRKNRKVYIGNCLGHSSNGAITYLAIDDDSGDHLVVKKWSLSPALDFETRNRQRTSLQQDLNVMCRLKHSSLVPYVAMETCKETNKQTSKECFYIIRDFVLGSSLEYLRKKICILSDKYEALRILRHVGLGVFSALKVLHSDNLVHRDVRCENVFLDDSGTVKLVGGCLDVRLADMMELEPFCESLTASQDIYATAQLLLSIVSRGDATMEIPPDLPLAAKDFFSRCLTEDERSQWTAEQLMNHAFLVDAPTKQIKRKEKDDTGSGSEDDEAVKRIHHPSPPVNSHSRLYAEFEVLDRLGEGAFGDVTKVKNKLDGGFYAIKRIKLNPENVQLNKKITREVKLLSRLNHENVVRYYNAWIESTTEPEDDETNEVKSSISVKKTKISLESVVAKLGQEVKVEWSMSEGTVQKISDSDEEDDDDADDFFVTSQEDDSSSIVEFAVDSDESMTKPSEDTTDSRPPSERVKQVLYIQMEFCEKHTLRHAIDNGLYHEHYKAWRLFREIVEGLAHVHQRGMIHRDLKPVNIFLDSNDHVKIGDFGLATKAFTLPLEDKSNKQEDFSGSLTGQIGTALYVAPELLQSAAKITYNQKVDIYSLGIILFEMFHPPLKTGMERMIILTKLRNKDIEMPQDFERQENAKQIHVIRWLLNHDASLRPTCAELLSSEHVPRPVTENTLSALLAHTLSERGSRGYQRLVNACLDQRPSPAEEFTYHSATRSKPLDVLARVKDAVVKVFRSHGATEFSPPLLIPRAKGWDQHLNAVKVMTSSGCVCHLPHDLRLPFARHIAYSETKYMRRYVVDRVYREKHVPGFHPREILECAFDIVTPVVDTLWTDAELLVVASRAASESCLEVCLQLNHTELLKTVLLSCGVALDKQPNIHNVLVSYSSGRTTSSQLQTHLTSLCIKDRDVSKLMRLMEANVTVYEVRKLVEQCVRENKYSRAIDKAVRELEAVCRNAEALGCDCPMTVAPRLAYNATQHSGVFWQMSVIRHADYKTNNKHRSNDLIAAGGRYNALVSEFWKVARTEKDSNSEFKNCAVGFSMSLERMAAIITKESYSLPLEKNMETTPIYVCLSGTAGNGREGTAAVRRAAIAKELWAAGYKCSIWTSNSADALEITSTGMLLSMDAAIVRVSYWEEDSIRENKIQYVDILDYVKQKLQPEIVKHYDGTTNRSISWSESEKSNSPSTSVTFITASEKMTKNAKRPCENQINTQITSILVSLGLQPVLSKVRVNVLALACEAACVRMLAAQLTAPLDVQELPQAFRPVCDTFFKRQIILEDALKELTNLVRQSNQKSADEIQLYAVYSIPDCLCRLIT